MPGCQPSAGWPVAASDSDWVLARNSGLGLRRSDATYGTKYVIRTVWAYKSTFVGLGQITAATVSTLSVFAYSNRFRYLLTAIVITKAGRTNGTSPIPESRHM